MFAAFGTLPDAARARRSVDDRVRGFLPFLVLTGACVLGAPAHAGSAGNAFTVQVNVADGGRVDPDDFCTLDNSSRAYEAVVTVVCGTGAVVQVSPPIGWRGWKPVHGGAYRFLLPAWPSGVMSEESDFFNGLGTVTSWRLVSLKDRDYLEMTLRW
jgi:hypothetical protein